MSRRDWKPRGTPGLRIANCSGFYGDRIAAAREMIEGGPIDFLTGDYLAELTMLILWKGQNRLRVDNSDKRTQTMKFQRNDAILR